MFVVRFICYPRLDLFAGLGKTYPGLDLFARLGKTHFAARKIVMRG